MALAGFYFFTSFTGGTPVPVISVCTRGEKKNKQ